MTTAHLNLARKWRSRVFDEIIGQELPVRMLKNSLYLESFFPVYLFSGSRGCGKTSMARVFASAINCKQIIQFQKDPKNASIPCLVCESCTAMAQGKHPDFIEIDAASHTGVDNVRQIVDAAFLLPVMGRKKIYLIDEAHMLSKAAFNAFLKILEEPPAGVLFILATTDPHKIIDTVKSRCFQLFFNPIQDDYLLNHLQNVCNAENIQCELNGLKLIVKASQGCVRDALNLLEQVRFSAPMVNKHAVLSVLGHIDDERLFTLFSHVATHGPQKVLALMQSYSLELYSAEFIWKQLMELARAALYCKHGVQSQNFGEYSQRLKQLVNQCSWQQINEIIDILYTQEANFVRTTAQHAFLEVVLLKIAQKNRDDDSSGASSVPHAVSLEQLDNELLELEEDDDDQDDQDEQDEDAQQPDKHVQLWAQFLIKVDTLQDPLLSSIFKQGVIKEINAGTLTVEFSKELSFFQGWLEDTQKIWQTHLNNCWGVPITLNAIFTDVLKNEKVQIAKSAAPVVSKPQEIKGVSVQQKTEKQNTYRHNSYSKPVQSNNNFFKAKRAESPESKYQIINVSDSSLWKQSHVLLQYFPGTVREIKESNHGSKA